MFFDESRPDRTKRALRQGRLAISLENSPIPPAKSYEFLTEDEIVNSTRTLAFDVESYTNYFEIGFRCMETGKVIYFETVDGFDEQQRERLTFLMFRHKLVGFNSRSYDLPMLMLAVQGVPAWKLKELTNAIILSGMQPFEIERTFGIRMVNVNHIDLIEVAPLDGSLKLYAARLHSERLQDLPYPHDAILTVEQMAIVRDYNINDLELTADLYGHLKEAIELRETLSADYKLDLRSKSDAQIAEAVISSELKKLGVDVKKPGIEPGKTFRYKPPKFIKFKTPQLQRAFETICAADMVVQENGYIDLPDEIKNLDLRLGICSYQMGIGGLHSSEKSVGYVADENTLIIDRDVASYYPAIILNNSFFPVHLTEAYLEVYRLLTGRRLRAKKDKLKAIADSLKIVINGGFGKLGNPYSIFYSPDLLIQVTLTGQLSLLMLIEMIELANIPVVSANTDGIVINCPKGRYADLETVVISWEEATGFITEETRYKSIWSRDVNNYIAVKEDNTCKLKGVYAEVGSALNSPLSKNPESYICSMAVQAFLTDGTPLHETIECGGVNVKTEYYPTVISRFISARRVTGGASKDGVYLGKVVRWYYAKNEPGDIRTVKAMNTVGKTEGARPLMILPKEPPADLDHAKYVQIAEGMLYDLGRFKRKQSAGLLI